jgi:hypothetical protein
MSNNVTAFLALASALQFMYLVSHESTPLRLIGVVAGIVVALLLRFVIHMRQDAGKG